MQLFEKSVLSITIVVFFIICIWRDYDVLPLFASSIDVNPGTFFLVYAIALTIVRPISGKLLDKFGEVFIILPALCITILAIVVLTLSNGLTGVMIAAILYGIGFGSAQPALQAAMLTIVDPSKEELLTLHFYCI